MVDIKIVGVAAGLLFAVAFVGYALIGLGNAFSDFGRWLGVSSVIQSGTSMTSFGISIIIVLMILGVILVVGFIIYHLTA